MFKIKYHYSQRNLIKSPLIFLIALVIFLFWPRIVFAQVVINEFLPNPASGGSEWVELYNLGGEVASLSGWLLEDNANHPKSLDSLQEIPPGGFAVYEYPGDGWLNNSSGDTVYLKDNTGNIVDNYSYSSDPGEEKSFGRTPDGTGGFIIFDAPTKGTPNPTPTPTPTPTPSPTPTPQPTLTPTSSPSPTPTPKPKSLTPTPTPKPPTATPTQKSSPSTSTQVPTSTPTPKPVKLSATLSGEILGEEQSSPAAFYPWEATEEGQISEQSSLSAKNKFFPVAFLATGFVLLFTTALWLWYNFKRR